MVDYFGMEDAVKKSNILDDKADLNSNFHFAARDWSFDTDTLIYAISTKRNDIKLDRMKGNIAGINCLAPIVIQRKLLDMLADDYCVTWRNLFDAQKHGDGLVGFKHGLVEYLYKRYKLSEKRSLSSSSSSSSSSKINTNERVSSSSMVFSWQKDFVNSTMTSKDFQTYLEKNWDLWINPVLEYLMKLVYPGIVDRSALIVKIMSDRDIQPFIRYALNKSKDHRLRAVIRIPSYSDEELFEAYRQIINNTSLHVLLKMKVDGMKALFFRNYNAFFNYLRNLPRDKKTIEMIDNIERISILGQIDPLFKEIKSDQNQDTQSIFIVGVTNDIVLDFLSSSNPELRKTLPKTISELKELIYPIVIEDIQMMGPVCETNTLDLLSFIQGALQNDTIAQTFFNKLDKEGIKSVDDLNGYVDEAGLPDLCDYFGLVRMDATKIIKKLKTLKEQTSF